MLRRGRIKAVKNGSKKPHARTSFERSHIYYFLDLAYQKIRELDTKAIYIFLGRGWLITIHSKETDLVDMGKNTFLKRNRRILESSIDALFYSLLSALVEKYEQLLTAVELKVLEFGSSLNIDLRRKLFTCSMIYQSKPSF